MLQHCFHWILVFTDTFLQHKYYKIMTISKWVWYCGMKASVFEPIISNTRITKTRRLLSFLTGLRWIRPCDTDYYKIFRDSLLSKLVSYNYYGMDRYIELVLKKLDFSLKLDKYRWTIAKKKTSELLWIITGWLLISGFLR